MAKAQTPSDPYVYQDLNEVPAPWRMHRSARLSLAQVNGIMRRAYDLGQWLEHPDGTPYFVPDEGQAREEFEATVTNENGVWVQTPPAKA